MNHQFVIGRNVAHTLSLRMSVSVTATPAAATGRTMTGLALGGSAMSVTMTVPTAATTTRSGALIRGFHTGHLSSGSRRCLVRNSGGLGAVPTTATTTTAVLHNGSSLLFLCGGSSLFSGSLGTTVSMAVTMSSTSALSTGCSGSCVHQLENLSESLGSGFRQSLTHRLSSRIHVLHCSRASGAVTLQCRVHIPFSARPNSLFRAQRIPQSRSANSASTSTDAFSGSEATPTAERACWEPKISPNSSDAPFATRA